MQRGLTAFQTGMDNVRNLTGSPIAGLDPHELIDVRPLLQVLRAGMRILEQCTFRSISTH
eukprot:scaffold149848_cov26-Tisochrysis_lutea.AAC.1